VRGSVPEDDGTSVQDASVRGRIIPAVEGEPLTPAVLQQPGALEMHFQPIVMLTTGRVERC
jgi:hypothetical protein